MTRPVCVILTVISVNWRICWMRTRHFTACRPGTTTATSTAQWTRRCSTESIQCPDSDGCWPRNCSKKSWKCRGRPRIKYVTASTNRLHLSTDVIFSIKLKKNYCVELYVDVGLGYVDEEAERAPRPGMRHSRRSTHLPFWRQRPQYEFLLPGYLFP